MTNSYKKFGYYYDEVMSELNYDLWLEFIEPYLNPNDKVLDLACGTATLATMLTLKGIHAEGLDLSESILEIAKEKMKVNHLSFPLYHADMVNFDLHQKYNMITCFFDSVNFLSDKKQIKEMFKTVYNHLEDNGLFIFDIFSKELFKEYEENDICEDYTTFKIKWTTKKASPTSLKHSIKILEDEETFSESYYEYFYNIKELPLNDGFKVLKICGDFNDDYQDGDERILIVLQKL